MLFFFSYARADKSRQLTKFYKELLQAVRSEAFLGCDFPFRDVDSIQPGKPWPGEIAEALRSCKVFVYLHSPYYFTRDGCGKEFKVILDRLLSTVGEGSVSKASCILPIYWSGPKHIDNVPNQISDLQMTHEDFGDLYCDRGMFQVMNIALPKQRWKVIHALAKRICDASTTIPLSPMTGIPNWHNIKPLFPIPSQSASNPIRKTGHYLPSQPRLAQFVWIVGKRAELIGTRNLDPYHEEDYPDEWLPFLPDSTDPARIIAQDAARELKLSYSSEPFPDDASEFTRRLNEWASQYTPVVVAVDLWSVELDRYRAALKTFELGVLHNCIVLFTWNLQDEETRRAADRLKGCLSQLFPVEYNKPDTAIVFHSVKDQNSFKEELVKRLTKITNDINRSRTARSDLPAGSAFSALPTLG